MRPVNVFMPLDGVVTLNVLPIDRGGRVIEMVSRELPVANEFNSGLFEVDNRTVLVNLAELQSMLRMDEAAKVEGGSKGTATRADGSKVEFETLCRVDTPVEVEYYRNGGILNTVLRKMMAAK